jgi:hypothetical protein
MNFSRYHLIKISKNPPSMPAFRSIRQTIFHPKRSERSYSLFILACLYRSVHISLTIFFFKHISPLTRTYKGCLISNILLSDVYKHCSLFLLRKIKSFNYSFFYLRNIFSATINLLPYMFDIISYRLISKSTKELIPNNSERSQYYERILIPSCI